MLSPLLRFFMLLTPLLRLGAQTADAVAFLDGLIRDPARNPTEQQILRQIEAIRLATDLKPILAAAFEASNSPYPTAQSYGASALVSLLQRPDGVELLKQSAGPILKLFDRSEPRMKFTSVMLTQWAKLPANLYERKFIDAMADERVPAEVKPALIRALIVHNSLVREKQDAITSFLRSKAPLQSLHESFNAVASNPMDVAWHADLVAIGLNHSEEKLREMCIGLLMRLGPNAILRHRAALLRIANDASEAPRVRDMAQRALGN